MTSNGSNHTNDAEKHALNHTPVKMSTMTRSAPNQPASR
jgi:hypothetical protein